jgi:lipopolysaccharide biosynthesis glycosyltransferase
MKTLTVVVGFDQRESVAYHAFCQSVLEKSSIPVRFLPLARGAMKFYTETHQDGSNAFIYSRFLTPFLCDYEGMAVFADGDMICLTDIAELARLYDPTKAVQVAKHDYKTKAAVKYLGNKNENCPRKNWSSLILWNCSHPANRVLTPALVQEKPGSFLHRFSWLDDSLIGELPKEWNWLETEYDLNPAAKLIHYTLGTPCFKDYEKSDTSDEWWAAYRRLTDGIGV